MEIKDILVVMPHTRGLNQIRLMSMVDAFELFPEYAFMLGSGSIIIMTDLPDGSGNCVAQSGLLNFDGQLFRRFPPETRPVFTFSKSDGCWIPQSGVACN